MKPIRRARCSDIYFSQFWRTEVQDQGAGRFSSWGGPSAWLAEAAFSLCGEREISHLLYVERERSLISSYKDTNPILGAPPSWPLLNLITSQKPHLLIPPHRGLEFQHMNLGATHSLHSTTSMKWKHNFLLLVLCKKIKCKALSTVLACRKAQNVLTMLLSFFIYAQSWIWNWFCINVSSWKLRLFTACNQTQQ